jgi:hypothetical protein
MAQRQTVVVGGVELVLPMLPNFIRSAQFEGHSWDVSTLTDEQIKELGEAWTLALIIHAAERRKGA